MQTLLARSNTREITKPGFYYSYPLGFEPSALFLSYGAVCINEVTVYSSHLVNLGGKTGAWLASL